MVSHLDGEVLFKAFLAGANEVRTSREHLNKINVFPVPDGDTGNNLVATLDLVAQAQPSKTLGYSLRSIADAILIGARGNSGIIFSQFVNGLTLQVGEVSALSTSTFGEAVVKAIPHAYMAISNPVEGTIITVMKEWAHAVHSMGNKTTDFVELLSNALSVARASLLETPQQLKILRDSRVVDSGAMGFVLFLEGFTNFIRTGQLPVSVSQAEVAVAKEVEPVVWTEGMLYRYCTEALLASGNLDMNEIRAYAEQLGDSVIVAGNDNYTRIHVHTNTPADLFYYLRQKGRIISQKVDDMKRQYTMLHDRKYPIALVTDSIADLPQELIDRYQIHVLPLNLVMEGATYLDKVTITPEKFYSLLDELKEYPTTAQPNLKYVENLLVSLRQHYSSIIAITVAQALSGTWNVFKQAADHLSQDSYPITVINSRLNSGAQGLLVLKAAELIDAGNTHDEVVDIVSGSIDKSHIYVSVSTFEYMVRGGRVSPLKGWLAKVLNMKPIASLDKEGKGVSFATAFSQESNTRKIKQIVAKLSSEHSIEKYSIVHAHAPEKAWKLGEELTRIVGKPPVYSVEISPIVGLSAGIGAVAVALLLE